MLCEYNLIYIFWCNFLFYVGSHIFFPIMAEKELSKQEFLKIICSLLSVQRSIRRVAQVSTLLITIVYKYKLY
jgi:hypothetical protein